MTWAGKLLLWLELVSLRFLVLSLLLLLSLRQFLLLLLLLNLLVTCEQTTLWRFEYGGV